MSRIVRIDGFTVDLATGRLLRGGVRVHLREQSFQVLAALIEGAGELVTREDLRRRLWSDDVFVDFENNLNTAVARLREALGDSADHPRFIETLPKRGYRLIASVTDAPRMRRTWRSGRSKVLVLPFVNSSGDPAQDYLSDAVTDEIITALAARAPDRLAVIARTTAMHYKDSRQDVAAIGHDLGVDHVVEGGVRSVGDSVALNVQLIRVADQTHVWAERFDVPRSDVFGTQQAIARAIGAHLHPDLTPDVSSVGSRIKKPTGDLVAYTLYQRGRHHLYQGTPASLSAAQRCFEQAIARDPRFALAYDALAELHWYLGFLGVLPPRAVTSKGLFYALRALDLDDRLAETRALVGLYRKELDFNWADVKREMDRAMAIDSTSAIVKLRYAIGWLLPECDFGRATAEIEDALETDPLSVPMRAWLGCMWWLDRQYDRAIEQGRVMVTIDSANHLGHWQLGIYLREQGLYEESIAEHQLAVELSGGSTLVLGWLGLALGQAGCDPEARRVLERLEEAGTSAYVPPTSVAWTHVGLGDVDRAFAWMDRAVEACDHMIMPIQSYPFLDPLRADPRYLVLLRKLKMKPTGGVRLDS